MNVSFHLQKTYEANLLERLSVEERRTLERLLSALETAVE